MRETVEIPEPVMHLIEHLKNRPDEKPIEVITRALQYYSDDYIDEKTEAAIQEGIQEFKAGKSISHEDLGKEFGFI
jgi:predicted transcriptional regulator